MKLPKVENIGIMGIILVIILTFFYFILGFSGMLSALGIILLFIVPLYLILDNFDLTQDEKIIFSFFIGVGIFPAITYWLGMFISFRIAILITFIVLIVTGYLIKKYYKR
jgi:apolipoprotein N-acyltransferase